MNLPCPAHPERPAHRGCHFCRRPICRLCELKMRGHLYCSTRCARDAGRWARWARLRQRLERPVPTRIAILSVFLAASAPLIFALRTVSTLDRLNAPHQVAPPRRPAALASIESVTETASGALLEGKGPEGAAVFLFAGGKLLGAVPVENGRFRFEEVREKGPYRVGALWLSPESAARSIQPGPSGAELSPEKLVPDLTHGPRDRRELVLSFDAGSSDRGAAEILEALRHRAIRSTIFLTGEFIRRYPALVRRIAEDGHEVGNHTDTHPHLTTYAEDGRQRTRAEVDRAYLARQLRRTSELYRETTRRNLAPLWRAPYGEHNAEIRRWAAEEGYWHVGWTGGRAGLDSLDWIADPQSPSYRSAERLVEHLLEHAENGGIVLLHLGSDRREAVGAKISLLLDGLEAQGFRLVPASEFLARSGRTDPRRASFAVPGAAAPR